MDNSRHAGAERPDRGNVKNSRPSADLHDGLNWFLSQVMFYGRAKLAGYGESGFASKDTNFTIDGDVYRYPQNGVLADISIEGELVWYQETIGSERKAPEPPARNRNSVQARFWRMLTGSQPLSSYWLRALAFGLSFPEERIDYFVEDFENRLFTIPAAADESGNARGLPRGCDPSEVKRQVKEMVTDERAFNAKAGAKAGTELMSQCEAALASTIATPGSIGVETLASMLKATKLEPGWEKAYETSQSLYSGGVSTNGLSSAMDLIDGSSRVMVLGDPGHGKSTVLSAGALKHCKDIPVFRLRFEDLGEAAAIRADETPFAQRTLQWAVEVLLDAAVASGLNTEGIYKHAVKVLMKSSNVLVIMDGLDEISTEKRRSLAHSVTVLLAGHLGEDGRWEGGLPGRMLMASRISGYTRPVGGIDEVLIDLLDKESLEPFMKMWFGEGNPAGLARALAAISDPELLSLARVPVIATFIAQIAAKEAPKTTKHDLYEQYLILFLSRPWKRTAKYDSSVPSRPQVLARLDFAAEVAWHMATWPVEDNIDQWVDHLVLGRLMAARPVGHPRQDWYQTVEDLHTIDGLLVPHSGLDSDDLAEREVRWIHRTIHEHLAARKLVSIIEDDYSKGAKLISHLMFRPAWEETLDHAAGLLGARGLSEELLNILWSLREKGDTPSRRILENISRFASHSPSQSHKVRTIEELYRTQWNPHSVTKLGEEALNTYFLEIEACSVQKEDVWQLCYRISLLLRAGAEIPAGLAVLKELSKKHWVAQLFLWQVQAGDAEVPGFQMRDSDLPERSSLPADISPQDMAPLLVKILISTLGTFLAFSSAQDLLETRHPDARAMLEEATRNSGREGEFLRLLNVGDNNGEWLNRISDELMEALLTDPGVPPYMVYGAAAEHKNTLLVEAYSGNPWALAGFRARWVNPDYSKDEATRIATLPDRSWDKSSAEGAVDSLLSRLEPTPQEMEMFWSASHWLITQRIPTRIAQMLQIYQMNDTHFWPQYWWTQPIFFLSHRIGEAFAYTEILEQIQATADFDVNVESVLGISIGRLGGQAKADATLDYVRQRISERRNRDIIMFGMFGSFENPVALGLQLIEIAEAVDRDSSRSIMDAIERLLVDGDKLWKYWPEVVRLSNS